jgi:hypothetical protein
MKLSQLTASAKKYDCGVGNFNKFLQVAFAYQFAEGYGFRLKFRGADGKPKFRGILSQVQTLVNPTGQGIEKTH